MVKISLCAVDGSLGNFELRRVISEFQNGDVPVCMIRYHTSYRDANYQPVSSRLSEKSKVSSVSGKKGMEERKGVKIVGNLDRSELQAVVDVDDISQTDDLVFSNMAGTEHKDFLTEIYYNSSKQYPCITQGRRLPFLSMHAEQVAIGAYSLFSTSDDEIFMDCQNTMHYTIKAYPTLWFIFLFKVMPSKISEIVRIRVDLTKDFDTLKPEIHGYYLDKFSCSFEFDSCNVLDVELFAMSTVVKILNKQLPTIQDVVNQNRVDMYSAVGASFRKEFVKAMNMLIIPFGQTSHAKTVGIFMMMPDLALSFCKEILYAKYGMTVREVPFTGSCEYVTSLTVTPYSSRSDFVAIGAGIDGFELELVNEGNYLKSYSYKLLGLMSAMRMVCEYRCNIDVALNINATRAVMRPTYRTPAGEVYKIGVGKTSIKDYDAI